MRHKILSAVFALAYLVLVQTSRTLHTLAFIMAGYIAALMLYNAWHLRHRELLSFWVWLKPALVVAAMFSALSVVYQWMAVRGLVLIASTLIIFLTELSVTLVSEQRNFFLTLVMYFCFVLGLFDLQFTFGVSGSVTLILLGLATYLVARSSFDYIPQLPKKKSFSATLLTLAILETGWTVLYLPIHFSAIALLVFNVFYVIWIVTYFHLFNNLTFKKVSFHIIFSTLIVLLALASTPWS